MFYVVVGHIVYSRLPVDKELSAAGAVADPVEAHFDGFVAVLFDAVISKYNKFFYCMGVAGWGWPSLRSSVRIRTSSCQLI